MDDYFPSDSDIIIQKFKKIKNEYIELKSANQNLEEALELLRERVIKKEQQKCSLISLFKKIVNENKIKMESLQKDNDHLHVTIQEQNQMIQDYSITINELRKKIDFLIEDKTDGNNDKPTDFTTQTITDNENKSYTKSNKNKTNFIHPSFNTATTETKKNQKKIRAIPNFRWSNLDIVKENSQIESNTDNFFNMAEPVSTELLKYEKRRKLYCPDDRTVNLENEDN